MGLTPEAFWRMTPCEWTLAQEGHAAAAERRQREIAKWISPLLSAQAGHVITPGQLLGEEEPEESPAGLSKRLKAAERKLARKQRAIERRAQR